MRPSKSRSRGKSRNNNRNPANNLNRVFESSGPEGKVRGTPQQIIDKYLQLARDAALANDQVAAENFQQHAEHYTRLLAEAQRDAEEKRAQADRANRERQQQQQQKQRERDDRDRARDETAPVAVVNDPGNAPQPDVLGLDEAGGEGPNLVETPEAKPRAKRAPRSRKPKQAEAPATTPASAEAPAEAAEPQPNDAGREENTAG